MWQELKREYERGQAEALAMARERVDQFRQQAKAKVGELESALAESNRKYEQDIEAAKALIGKLRTVCACSHKVMLTIMCEQELKSTQNDRDKLTTDLGKAVAEKERLAERSRAVSLSIVVC